MKKVEFNDEGTSWNMDALGKCKGNTTNAKDMSRRGMQNKAPTNYTVNGRKALER